MKLYEISKTAIEAKNMLLENEIDQETYEDTLEFIELELKNKSSNIIYIKTELNSKRDNIKNEIKRLQELEKIYSKAEEKLDKYVLQTMQKMDKTKIETDMGIFSISSSTRTEIADNLPEKFFDIVKTETKKRRNINDLKKEMTDEEKEKYLTFTKHYKLKLK